MSTPKPNFGPAKNNFGVYQNPAEIVHDPAKIVLLVRAYPEGVGVIQGNGAPPKLQQNTHGKEKTNA